MPQDLVRPDLYDEQGQLLPRFAELESYLLEQCDRAFEARRTQVDTKLADWEKGFSGTPAEKTRTVPWYNSSNFVVKLTRLFIETFVARTLNIVFSTNPLYQVDGFSREVRESVQVYMHKKAIQVWRHYDLFRQMLTRGTKQGTAVVKVVWSTETTIDVAPSPGGQRESEVTTFDGPKAACIPFDDFGVFPITANDFTQVEIKFHRVRYTEERARQLVAKGKWLLSDEEVRNASKMPQDIKRRNDQEEAGVVDNYLRELSMVECYLEWDLRNDGRHYCLVAVICPEIRRLVDLYFNPAPSNYESFYLYKPSPKEDFFFGESWPEILAQSQEEASQIHNDRRNAAFLGSAPVFKRRKGADIPNPSTNWYPGKVFDVEEMDDFEAISVGRSIGDLLSEEMQVISLAERLMGIGPVMQGMSAGQSDKRGIYNTGGVLAVMSEGNQRQDTNIKDAREVLGDIAKCSFYLQSFFGQKDPFLDVLDPSLADGVRQAFSEASLERLRATKFEIRASTAAANKEIEKASLLQMANVIGSYGQSIQQLAPMAITAQEPIRSVILKILDMSHWMIIRLLRAFEEYDVEGVVPDVRQLLSGGAATAGALAGAGPAAVQSASPIELERGGTGGAGGAVTREQLASLRQVVEGARANAAA